MQQAKSQGNNTLVLLKIPTQKLKATKFKIRPQDEVLDFTLSTHFYNLASAFADKSGIYNNKQELPKNLTKGYSPLKAKEFLTKIGP